MLQSGEDGEIWEELVPWLQREALPSAEMRGCSRQPLPRINSQEAACFGHPWDASAPPRLTVQR